MAYYGGGAVAAAYAAMAQAVKASGSIVRVEPQDFKIILSKNSKPLVVMATGGFINKNYQYLTGYKGLSFFTKSSSPLNLSGDVELVEAKQIWMPS